VFIAVTLRVDDKRVANRQQAAFEPIARCHMLDRRLVRNGLDPFTLALRIKPFAYCLPAGA